MMKNVCACIACTFFIVFIVLLPMTIIDQTETNQLVETDCTIVSKSKNSYTCCDQICSGCHECGSRPYCSSLLDDKIEGKCCSGDRCCASYDGESNGCVTYRDELCEVKCGKCHKPQVVLKHTVLEPAFKVYQDTMETQCGMDDTKCPDNFLNMFPAFNKTMTCYYHPDSPDEIQLDDTANIAMLVSCIVFGILFFITVVAICFV